MWKDGLPCDIVSSDNNMILALIQDDRSKLKKKQHRDFVSDLGQSRDCVVMDMSHVLDPELVALEIENVHKETIHPRKS